MAVKLIRARRVAALAVTVSMFFTLLPTPAAHAATETEIRTKLYELVNQARKARGLRVLKVNSKTQYWARDHAGWMSRQGPPLIYDYHDSDRELNQEVMSGWQFRSENIGWVFPASAPGVAKLLHTSLMASQGHRENILRRRNTHMGFGVKIRDGNVWLTQRFVDNRW